MTKNSQSLEDNYASLWGGQVNGERRGTVAVVSIFNSTPETDFI